MAGMAPRTSRFRRLALLATAGSTALVAGAPIPAADAAPVRTTAAERSIAATVARGKVGRPYQWGATGPSSFDCSGLVGFAYRLARHPLPVRTSQQMWRLGARIPRSRVRRGDLVFTYSLGHVGLYLGAGRYVHAPGRGRRIEVAPLPSGRAFIGAVRP